MSGVRGSSVAAGVTGTHRAPTEPWLAPVVPLRRPSPNPVPAAPDPGHRDTIVETYLAEQGSLFRFARAGTGDDEAAEDVLQEAFVRLIREVAAGRTPDNVHAWLFRVATNLIVSLARRARTAERHLADLDHDGLTASPEHHVLITERDQAVRDALDALPVDGRVALLLAAKGFSGREIAQTLGRTEGAVRTLLCRSRGRVREQLEPDTRLVGRVAG